MRWNRYTKIAVLFLLISSHAILAQTETKPQETSKIETKLEGMLGFSAGKNAIAINVGGPSLKYKFSKTFKLGIGAFPSLLLLHKKVAPRLAFSPVVEYKKWLFLTPYYGYDANNDMIWTFGLGYKF